LSATAVAEFLMKRGESIPALFSLNQNSPAPNAAVKWRRNSSFAPIADKGFHEAYVDQAKKGLVCLSLPTVVFGPCPG